jgi:hypothetical protein
MKFPTKKLDTNSKIVFDDRSIIKNGNRCNSIVMEEIERQIIPNLQKEIEKIKSYKANL